jgi:hypothetical protein
MGQYFKACDLDKQEYICPWCVGGAAKLWEWAANPWGRKMGLAPIRTIGACPNFRGQRLVECRGIRRRVAHENRDPLVPPGSEQVAVVLSFDADDFVGSAFAVDQQIPRHDKLIGGMLLGEGILDGRHIAFGAKDQLLSSRSKQDCGKRSPR